MGVSISLMLSKAAESLSPESLQDIDDRGALDPEQVRVQFHTQEDEKVRPSHQALDGLIGRPGDPLFPVPPLDYGCRCFVSYLAREGTAAAHFLPSTTKPMVEVVDAYAKYLDTNLDDWKKIKASLKGLPRMDAMAKAVLAIKKAKPELDMSEVRDYARMLVQASP